MRLSTFALNIGYALVVLIVAVAAWAAFRKRRSLRANTWLGLPRELEALRDEFHQLIEASHGEARKALKIGETVVAAMKPTESALRDFKKRITELEKRADASDKRSAELQSSLAELDKRISVRLDGISQQLTAATDQLSGLKQIMEGQASEHGKTREEMRAIASNLATVQSQAAGLSQRADLAETNDARLSAVTQSMAQSVAALQADSKETAQQVSTLEPRFLWKLDELATRVDSTLAALNRPPEDDAKDRNPDGPPDPGNQTTPDEGERAGNDRASGAAPIADAPAKPPDGAMTGEQPPLAPDAPGAGSRDGQEQTDRLTEERVRA
jgi:archaellum component FlaC